MDQRVRLLGVARPVVEDVAVGRIVAHHIGAGVGREEQHAPLQRERNRDGGSGGAEIADEAEHLLAVVELPHRVERARRIVAIIRGHKLQHTAVDAAGLVDAVERRLDAELELTAALLHRAAGGDDHAELDLALTDAAHIACGRQQLRRRGRGLRACRSDRHDGQVGSRLRWRRNRLFEVAKLAVRAAAVEAAAGDQAAAFGDVLIEQARQLVAIGFARRRFADDSLEFLDDRLNARSRNVAAGERRADDGADAGAELADQRDIVAGRGKGAARHEGGECSDGHAGMSQQTACSRFLRSDVDHNRLVRYV